MSLIYSDPDIPLEAVEINNSDEEAEKFLVETAVLQNVLL